MSAGGPGLVSDHLLPLLNASDGGSVQTMSSTATTRSSRYKTVDICLPHVVLSNT